MAFDIGQLLQGFPLANAGQQPVPGQVPMVQAGGTPPIMPQAPDPTMAGGPAGTTGYIPPAAHPTLKGKIGALFQDPNFNNALITFGANLMQSPQRGQNLGDVFGQSLMAGMNAYRGGKMRDEQKMDKKKAEAAAAQKNADQLSLDNERLNLTKEELAARRADTAARAADSEADRKSREKIAGITADGRGTGRQNMSGQEMLFDRLVKARVDRGQTQAEAETAVEQMLFAQQKERPESTVAMNAYTQAMTQLHQAHLQDPTNIGRPVDPAVMAAWQQTAAQAARNARDFYVNGASGNVAAPPPGAAPAPGGAAPVTPPAPSTGGRGGAGKGTQTAPFSVDQAEKAASLAGRPITVWVINPETKQSQQVTVTPAKK